MPPAKRGPEPSDRPERTRAHAAVERREAKRPHQGRSATAGLRKRACRADRRLVRRSALHLPLSHEGAGRNPGRKRAAGAINVVRIFAASGRTQRSRLPLGLQ